MARVTAATATAPSPGALGAVGLRSQPLVLAREQVLPVLPAFERLLPEPGLRRGTVTRTHGPGATSLALALLARGTTEGSWVAAIGLRSLGLAAAGELGVVLSQLLLVDVPPGPQWATAVAAALDGVDAVLLEVPPRCREADARRLQARLRDRGAVVVLVGAAGPFQPDLVVAGSTPRWYGVGCGWGHLRARCLPVEVSGRRAASRSRTARLWLPDPDGEVRLEESPAVEHPDARACRGKWASGVEDLGAPGARSREVVVPFRPPDTSSEVAS
jgi:hypothetical protein